MSYMVSDKMRGIRENSPYYGDYSLFCELLRHRILQLRKERGLTQEQMEDYGLSLRQFQRIESGETTNITLSNLFRISKALQMPLEKLLDVKTKTL